MKIFLKNCWQELFVVNHVNDDKSKNQENGIENKLKKKEKKGRELPGKKSS